MKEQRAEWLMLRELAVKNYFVWQQCAVMRYAVT